MKSEWESRAVDDLFALHELMGSCTQRKAEGQEGQARASIAGTQSAVKANGDGEAWPAF